MEKEEKEVIKQVLIYFKNGLSDVQEGSGVDEAVLIIINHALDVLNKQPQTKETFMKAAEVEAILYSNRSSEQFFDYNRAVDFMNGAQWAFEQLKKD